MVNLKNLIVSCATKWLIFQNSVTIYVYIKVMTKYFKIFLLKISRFFRFWKFMMSRTIDKCVHHCKHGRKQKSEDSILSPQTTHQLYNLLIQKLEIDYNHNFFVYTACSKNPSKTVLFFHLCCICFKNLHTFTDKYLIAGCILLYNVGLFHGTV